MDISDSPAQASMHGELAYSDPVLVKAQGLAQLGGSAREDVDHCIGVALCQALQALQ